MLPIIAGTIKSAVNLAVMDQKWQERKKNLGQKKKEELTPEQRQIKQYQEDLKQMRESSQMAALDAKLKSGAALTPEEIDYLQKKEPEKYREYMEIKAEKEAYKNALKACRTKDDVERLKFNKMGQFAAAAKKIANNPNIPKSQKLAMIEKILRKAMGVAEVHQKFVESEEYRKMPTEQELAEEKKEQNRELAEAMGGAADQDDIMDQDDVTELTKDETDDMTDMSDDIDNVSGEVNDVSDLKSGDISGKSDVKTENAVRKAPKSFSRHKVTQTSHRGSLYKESHRTEVHKAGPAKNRDLKSEKDFESDDIITDVSELKKKLERYIARLR